VGKGVAFGGVQAGHQRGNQLPVEGDSETLSRSDAADYRRKVISMRYPSAFILTLVLALNLASPGCDRKPGAAASPADPVQSFEGFQKRFLDQLEPAFAKERAWSEESGNGPVRRTIVIGRNGEGDVRKTDSLVSPYVATLRVKARQVDGESRTLAGTWTVPLTFSFACQQGKWVLMSAVIGDYATEGRFFKDHDVTDGDTAAFRTIKERLNAAAVSANAP
jgi:hypothetical protein